MNILLLCVCARFYEKNKHDKEINWEYISDLICWIKLYYH